MANSRWTSSRSGQEGHRHGGNTGLGRAFSVALAKRAPTSSCRAWRTTTARLDACRAVGRRHEFLKIDITAPGAPALVVETWWERFGGVDILVNSAGVCPMADVLEFGRTQWDATVAVNLTAAFELGHEPRSG